MRNLLLDPCDAELQMKNYGEKRRRRESIRAIRPDELDVLNALSSTDCHPERSRSSGEVKDLSLICTGGTLQRGTRPYPQMPTAPNPTLG